MVNFKATANGIFDICSVMSKSKQLAVDKIVEILKEVHKDGASDNVIIEKYNVDDFINIRSFSRDDFVDDKSYIQYLFNEAEDGICY